MNPDALDASPKKSRTAQIAWIVLIIATLYVCYFSHLGALGFIGPDEPRYAWIARAMTETGDWVTPRLYGQPWFEKPPLYYWGAALSFKLFGVSEAAARLPSAISALLATLAMAWLAWRVYGPETARWLLLLLPTTVGMIGFSHAAATDMPFSGMLTIAMVCAAVVLGLPRTGKRLENSESCHSEGGVGPRNLLLLSFIAKSRFLASLGMTFTRSQKTSRNARADQGTRWLALILFGFFLGLAVLAKGPAGIILSGGAVFFWALFTKRWRDAFRLLHPAAIASFCATALPWYILCARRNPDFFHVFIIEHNFQRFLTPEFHHIQPFWYYGPVLIIAMVPWIILLPAFLRDISAQKLSNLLHANSLALYLGCWGAFTLLFFSVSQSKLPGYILPGLPPLLLLIVRSTTRRMSRTIRWIGVLAGLTVLSGAAAIVFWSDRLPLAIDYFPPQPLGWIALLLLLMGVAAIVLATLRRSRFALALVVVAIIGSVAWSLTGDTRWALNYGVSTGLRGMTAAQANAQLASAPVCVYKLNRALHYNLNFYFHRELRECESGTLPVQAFTSPGHLSDLRQIGFHCPSYVAFPSVVVCRGVFSPPAAAGRGQLQ